MTAPLLFYLGVMVFFGFWAAVCKYWPIITVPFFLLTPLALAYLMALGIYHLAVR